MKKTLFPLLLLVTLMSCGQDTSSISNLGSISPSSTGTTSPFTSSQGTSNNNPNSFVSPSSGSSSASSSAASSTRPISSTLYAAEYENNTPADYYESCRGLKGEALKDALHEIIKGHTSFSYSSTTKYFTEIDRDPYDSSKVYFIYTGNTQKGTSYNKEHVWAKSKGDFGTSQPTGTDLHNLHPCNATLNSNRSNYDFKEGGTLLTQFEGNNRKGDGTFEPSDFSKGDVARTIFYMAVRYEGENNEPDLELNSPSSSQYLDLSSGADGVHGNFDDLYQWTVSGMDPVDDHEVYRNNIIYSSYQHNRNPFIDHPEFIPMIYDKTYDGPGALLDMDPLNPNLSAEEEAERFKELVQKLDNVTLNSENDIIAAEKYYQEMSDEAKALVANEYQLLLKARETLNQLKLDGNIEQIISLIDSIGEVTLSDKDLFDQIETLLKEIPETERNKITNYNTYLQLKAEFDVIYEEYLQTSGEDHFNANFSDSVGAKNKYDQYDVTLADHSFSFSTAFKSGTEFRFGGNGKNYIEPDDKFKNAIPESYTNIFSCEFNFIIHKMRQITLTYNTAYGIVDSMYLLISQDNGSTYSVVSKINKADADKTKSFVYDISSYTEGKYAFVIAGDAPRLQLFDLIIE